MKSEAGRSLSTYFLMLPAWVRGTVAVFSIAAVLWAAFKKMDAQASIPARMTTVEMAVDSLRANDSAIQRDLNQLKRIGCAPLTIEQRYSVGVCP